MFESKRGTCLGDQALASIATGPGRQAVDHGDDCLDTKSRLAHEVVHQSAISDLQASTPATREPSVKKAARAGEARFETWRAERDACAQPRSAYVCGQMPAPMGVGALHTSRRQGT